MSFDGTVTGRAFWEDSVMLVAMVKCVGTHWTGQRF